MWNTGYALTEIHQLADPNGVRTKAFLSDFARTHRVNIIGGSIADKRDDRVLNTIYAFDREGAEIAEYSKIHSVPSHGRRKVSAQRRSAWPI